MSNPIREMAEVNKLYGFITIVVVGEDYEKVQRVTISRDLLAPGAATDPEAFWSAIGKQMADVCARAMGA